MSGEVLLRASGLGVVGRDGTRPVDGVDLALVRGRVLALTGPSGAGKSLTVRALAGLLPPALRAEGTARLGGTELVGASRRTWRGVRRRLAWVGQDAVGGLNPVRTAGAHLVETARAQGVPVARARDVLEQVGLDRTHLRAYPFELSGGQAQRLAVALAVLGGPEVLLADEVTASLDVVTQARVLDLLRAQADAGRAVLLVTHDVAAAARWADDLAVLDAGRLVEQGPVDPVLAAPRSSLLRAWTRAAR